MPSRERLSRLLGGDELGWLRDRVRRRLERGEPLIGVVTLAASSPAQRDAVEGLLGRRPRSGAGLSVRLEDVDQVLRGSGAHPDGLAAAVVALTGPVRDRAATQAERAAAWRAALAPLDGAVAGRLELREWAEGVLGTGAVKRAAREPEAAAVLVGQLASVLAVLPREAEPIGRFAERILGDAHALDADRPLTGLVFGAARALGGVGGGEDGVGGGGEGAAWRREVWASVGLLRDELSSTVLVLNLPAAPDTPTGRTLAEWADVGEPAVLTLRQLRNPPALGLAGRTLSICENPVVVAEAADRLGPAGGPLVCLNGQPGVAAMTLLRAAARAGARLRYHGDFDWGGLRIGNVLFARLPVTPWRFDTAAYTAAAAAPGRGRPLTGDPTSCTWDPDLTAAMQRAGQAVEEERVLDHLLADLAEGSPAAPPLP